MTNEEVKQLLRLVDRLQQQMDDLEMEREKLQVRQDEVSEEIEDEMISRGRNYFNEPLTKSARNHLEAKGYKVGHATEENDLAR